MSVARTKASAFWLIVMVAACVVQFVWIYDYLPIAAKEVQDARRATPISRVNLITANVLQSNQDSKSVIDPVTSRKPDILALCEVNHRWIDKLAPLERHFVHHVVHPQENEYGVHCILSCQFTGRRSVTSSLRKFRRSIRRCGSVRGTNYDCS